MAPSLSGRSGEVAATDGMSSKPKPGARVTAGETEILPRPAAEGKTEREARKRRRENGVNDLRAGARLEGSARNSGRGVPSSNKRGRPLVDVNNTQEGEAAVERHAAGRKKRVVSGTPAQRGPDESQQETLDRVAFQKRQEHLDAVRIKVGAVRLFR